MVRRRLGCLLWRYAGGTAADVGFMAAVPFLYQQGADKMLFDLYRRVASLVRYLRQDMAWAWKLDIDEAGRWEAVLAEILRDENGGGDGGPPAPQHSPWGFGDWDAGG